jgi:Pro-Pro endopeptidase
MIVLSLSYYKISQASVGGITLADFTEGTILIESLGSTPRDEIDDVVILPERSFNQKEAANMIKRLSQLPKPLLEQIQSQGIKVKLFEGKLTDNPTASHLKGVIPRGYKSVKTWDDVPGIGGGKIVLVKIGASEKGSGHGSVNLELHELAHSIDRYILNDLRYHGPFLDIWEKERADLFPGQSYFLLFPEEYFAESFAMFFLNDETQESLYERAPQTYQFIHSLTERKMPDPILNL